MKRKTIRYIPGLTKHKIIRQQFTQLIFPTRICIKKRKILVWITIITIQIQFIKTKINEVRMNENQKKKNWKNCLTKNWIKPSKAKWKTYKEQKLNKKNWPKKIQTKKNFKKIKNSNYSIKFIITIKQAKWQKNWKQFPKNNQAKSTNNRQNYKMKKFKKPKKIWIQKKAIIINVSIIRKQFDKKIIKNNKFIIQTKEKPKSLYFVMQNEKFKKKEND